jgi:hypothetical protein
MDMQDPPHPGEIVRDDYLKPLGISVTAAAKWLGLSRQSVSERPDGVTPKHGCGCNSNTICGRRGIAPNRSS